MRCRDLPKVSSLAGRNMAQVSNEQAVQPSRSARPGRRARVVASAAILLAGVCGGLIGYALVEVSCSGDCGWLIGTGTLVGAVAGAVGVAIVASLTLRAMNEWRAAGTSVAPGRGGIRRTRRLGRS